ncbi:DUF4440 domain-containing protein [Kocuria indica]|uniref:DUF4440 domain-containing protein n=1 Tax=Kocuria marina subsp. indica TaxID=1049583 RepID=A0A6N9R140_9MICC|nr:nuclear transport factor 2 family protein [Kocuria indica]NDO78933.1 DUF4440 domain-containing protein [Kocuria indica]
MTDKTDQQQIRELIEHWVAAIRARDLDGVIARHAEDIVMFDVPPPQRGARGLSEYRGTWPDFFEWIASGAVFEIVELDVVAGTDVAYAVALLRCGHPADLSATPDQRLRLSLGLVKRADEWLVQHEHHSFCYVADLYRGEESVREIHQGWFADTAAKNLDGIMNHIAPDVVSYEHEAPLEYIGVEEVREMCRSGLDQTTGQVTWTVPELQVVARDDLAVAWGLNHMTAQMPDGTPAEDWSRGTRVFRRNDGEWTMVHQHVSHPRVHNPSAPEEPEA